MKDKNIYYIDDKIVTLDEYYKNRVDFFKNIGILESRSEEEIRSDKQLELGMIKRIRSVFAEAVYNLISYVFSDSCEDGESVSIEIEDRYID